MSSLKLSGADFGEFSPDTTSYTAEVSFETSRTSVTATTNHSGASYVIKLRGVEAAAGVVRLKVGRNVIMVEVTAEDRSTTVTYAVTVTRDSTPIYQVGELPSDDPPVNFRITSFDEDEVSLAWEIPHNRGVTNYALERYDHDGKRFLFADWTVSGDVRGGGSVRESSEGLTAGSLYRYDLVLKSDAETVIMEKSLQVQTLAPGATAQSSDTTLSALSLSGIELVPEFASSIRHYSGGASRDVSQTSVTATSNDSDASHEIRLGGTADADGVISLVPGRNVITVHVTAEDGVTTGFYTIVVRREKAGNALSSDASLRSLWLRGIYFGRFDPDRTSYLGEVATDVSHTVVTPVRSDVEASHVISLDGIEHEDGYVPLSEGENVILVEVTAEDGETTRAYTVIVNRAIDTCALSIEAEATIEGTWDSTCVSVRSAPDGNDERYARFFEFTLSEAAEVTITLESDENTLLYLLEGHGKDGELLFENEGVSTGNANRISRLNETLQPGDYTIEATTYDTEREGDFTLTIGSLREAELPPPEPEADPCWESIDADGAIEGSWNDTCLSVRRARVGNGEVYARFFEFTLIEVADVTITLESDEDTFLYLSDGHGKDGEILHENDDIATGGANLNSRLSVALQPGDYSIEATTYYAERADDFTLTIEGLGEAAAPEPGPGAQACRQSIATDGVIEGSWDATCLSDRTIKHDQRDRYARYYTFTLSEASDITITLVSEEDTYLYLLEGNDRTGTILYENDDISYGTNTNSRLSENLPSGDYTIEATTYDALNEGDFGLRMEGLVSLP